MLRTYGKSRHRKKNDSDFLVGPEVRMRGVDSGSRPSRLTTAFGEQLIGSVRHECKGALTFAEANINRALKASNNYFQPELALSRTGHDDHDHT
jgi:hypothetical protein